MSVQHVFLIGAKSLGAYGGYETFINKLTEYHTDEPRLKYHVACKENGDGSRSPEDIEGAIKITDKTFVYHNADCYQIRIPEKLGSAQAIYYDCKALEEAIQIIKNQKICNSIVYIMACRIGPFFGNYVKQIHKLGGKVYLNPDGHEWKRAKWSKPIREYWKYSEKLMVKRSDLIICDSVTIEKYIHECYKKYQPKTTYIAYGAETRKSIGAEDSYAEWLLSHNLRDGEFYLIVGRFVPENNFETMIREFMLSNSERDLVIITNVNSSFMDELENKLHYSEDQRIRFVGTVYDQELLKKIREQAYGYLHGHEVGGTNPSLIEALGSTDINLLLKVGFNEEVGKDAAVYWSKKRGNLARLIDRTDHITKEQRQLLGQKAKKRVKTAFSWEFISRKYAEVFLKN